MTDLHVIADERTNRWRVYESDPRSPLSEHSDATAAEAAARTWAHRRGVDRVVVHDRYHRTHDQVGLDGPRASASDIPGVREGGFASPTPTSPPG